MNVPQLHSDRKALTNLLLQYCEDLEIGLRVTLSPDQAPGLPLRQFLERWGERLDREALSFLKKQEPGSESAKWGLCVLRMGTWLARVGEVLSKLALQGTKTARAASLAPNLSRMAHDVKMMIRDAFEAHETGSQLCAQNVLILESLVSNLRRQLSAELLASLKRDLSNLEISMDLLGVVDSLGRIADQASFLAEEVTFGGSDGALAVI